MGFWWPEPFEARLETSHPQLLPTDHYYDDDSKGLVLTHTRVLIQWLCRVRKPWSHHQASFPHLSPGLQRSQVPHVKVEWPALARCPPNMCPWQTSLINHSCHPVSPAKTHDLSGAGAWMPVPICGIHSFIHSLTIHSQVRERMAVNKH